METDQDETGRVAALKGYGMLDTPSEPEFDAIVREAASLFGTPIALISLIDEKRQWFKARVGIDVRETPRASSFCTHAIRSIDVMTVYDVGSDDRFAANPVVTNDPRIQFYAGAPLKTPTGWRIGTLCVMDSKPHRTLTVGEAAKLEELAARTMALFGARRARRTAREKALAA